MTILVAPARERGLKSPEVIESNKDALGRSREGAGIEIPKRSTTPLSPVCRSREGAGIEIASRHAMNAQIASLPRGSGD